MITGPFVIGWLSYDLRIFFGHFYKVIALADFFELSDGFSMLNPVIVTFSKLRKMKDKVLTVYIKEHNLIFCCICVKTHVFKYLSMLRVFQAWCPILKNFLVRCGFYLDYGILYQIIQLFFLVGFLHKFT